eukprot:766448_1
MKLQYAATILVGLPIVAIGDSLRGTPEKANAVDPKDKVERKGRRLFNKATAAQKRQIQRDNRRQIENPYRGQDEEMRERARKRIQAERRNKPWVEPNNEDYGAYLYREGREVNRYRACNRRGEGCDYVTNLDTYERLVDRDRRRADRRARLYDDLGSVDNDLDSEYDSDDEDFYPDDEDDEDYSYDDEDDRAYDRTYARTGRTLDDPDDLYEDYLGGNKIDRLFDRRYWGD